MRDGKIAIEIDLKKIAIEIDLKKIAVVAGMVLCTWLAGQCGEGETLMLIIPAGIAYLAGGEK